MWNDESARVGPNGKAPHSELGAYDKILSIHREIALVALFRMFFQSVGKFEYSRQNVLGRGRYHLFLRFSTMLIYSLRKKDAV
jgi:hypothetical protein